MSKLAIVLLVTFVAATVLLDRARCDSRVFLVGPMPPASLPIPEYFYGRRGKRKDEVSSGRRPVELDNGKFLDMLRRLFGIYDLTNQRSQDDAPYEMADENEEEKPSRGIGKLGKMDAGCDPDCQEEIKSVSNFIRKFHAVRGKRSGNKDKFIPMKRRQNTRVYEL